MIKLDDLVIRQDLHLIGGGWDLHASYAGYSVDAQGDFAGSGSAEGSGPAHSGSVSWSGYQISEVCLDGLCLQP